MHDVKMRVYLASRFSNREMLKGIREQLRGEGIECTSRWIDGEVGETPESIAQGDLDDVARADALILVTHDCERVPGGMHFEAGYAKGLGKAVYRMGPSVNVFCSLLPDWK